MACASSPTAARPTPGPAHRRDDVGLHRVGVLVLVDEHVVEARAQRRGRRRAIAAQRTPVEQQIVVVERRCGRACARVARRTTLAMSSTSSPHHGNARSSTSASVSWALTHAAVDGEPACPSAGNARRARRARARGGRAPIRSALSPWSSTVNPGRQADGRAVLAQQAVGDRRGTCRPTLGGPLPPRRAGRPACTISRAARRVKVSSRMRSGCAPARQQARHAAGERPGLAGPGAGDDQQVAAVVEHGPALLGVQIVEPGKHLFDPSGDRRPQTWTVCSSRFRPVCTPKLRVENTARVTLRQVIA